MNSNLTVYYKLVQRAHAVRDDMQWLAIAKVGPFTDGIPIDNETGILWFGFGAVGQEAIDNVVAEVKAAGFEADAVVCDGGER